MSRPLNYPTWCNLHAWLLVGNDVVVKQAWLINEVKKFYCDGDGIDNCDICRSIDNQTHPDFTVLSQKKWTVSDIQDIRQTLSMTAFNTGRIIYIPDADNLLRGASRGLSNRLLKSIEEPPTPTWFFFGVSAQTPIQPTIRNRCGSMHFADKLSLARRQDLVTLLADTQLDPEEITQAFYEAWEAHEIDYQWLWLALSPKSNELQDLLRSLPDRLERNSDLFLQLRVLIPLLQAELTR